MDFKHNLLKNKDKNVQLDRNYSNSHFQKRLESYLKTSPFKQIPLNPNFSRENIEKLKQSLIPIMLMKASIFNAIKHHEAISNKNQKAYYLHELKEIQSKIEFLKEKPCEFLAKTFENSAQNRRNRKLLEIILKINRLNTFYSEKVRQCFHLWRLFNFANGLRKIDSHHREILEKQVPDQFNNIYIAVVKKTMKNAFGAIFEFANGQGKKIKKIKKMEKMKKMTKIEKNE